MSWDGWGGVYRDPVGFTFASGFGIVKINSVGTAMTNSNGKEFVSYIPSNAVGEENATYKWARSVWNDVDGYPSTVMYYQQRLFLLALVLIPKRFGLVVVGTTKTLARKPDTR